MRAEKNKPYFVVLKLFKSNHLSHPLATNYK
jgi:hypothetical protein